MLVQAEIILLASVVASACAIPGVFLVLRKMSLLSDAIGHSILLGIVLGFFISRTLNSPLLIIGAALMGVFSVFLTQKIKNTGRVKEDASIGLVFPFLFSLGVILITRFASRVHIDTDAVLLGEIGLAPFNRLVLGGIDLGPVSLWIMSTVLALNVLYVITFYKELKLVSFDQGLAKSLGFSTGFIHYSLMTLVSITTVSAFDSVGAVLVVALIIAPAASAYLLVNSVSSMLFLSAVFGVLSAVTGYALASMFNASIAGAIAVMTGVFFLCAFLFSPRHGAFFRLAKKRGQKKLFSLHMLLVHLLDHEKTRDEPVENTIANAVEHMKWAPAFSRELVLLGTKKDWLYEKKQRLYLTSTGRSVAKQVMQTTRMEY
ncbi:zinc ABC transporter permease [archaeon CG10_big_fil_rev_8_21_14_0_10_43_11]|nr:MAG: zinc ABC transporter permease [archaeon CG10_big_fil_rev_8_21_14_0_10_43_11]